MKKTVALFLIFTVFLSMTVGIHAESSSLELPTNTAIVSITQDDAGNYYVNNATYSDYARNPAAHKNEKIRFTGKVVQVVEGNYSSVYRIAVDRNSDYIMHVTFYSSTNNDRVLENDNVTVYATYSGLLTYESTMGVSITVPSCKASKIEIAGNSGISTAEMNSSGQYIITKHNYGDFARNPSNYLNKAVTFNASIEQVIEGSVVTYYRLAIDGDINCMFYAKITNNSMTTRLLENDSITVTGLYQGLYTYEGILGQSITIPSCSISKYSLIGDTAEKTVSIDEEGYHWITSSNYDEYARNESSHLSEKIRFCGKVVQVSESVYGVNTYRIAVDSDFNCMFYVKYVLPQGASRILEDDYVFLSGTFRGLCTYTTIFGASVTIPEANATDIADFHTSLSNEIALGNHKLETTIDDAGSKSPVLYSNSVPPGAGDISEKGNNSTSGNTAIESSIKGTSSTEEQPAPPVQYPNDEIGDFSEIVNDNTLSSRLENNIEDSSTAPRENISIPHAQSDEVGDHSENNTNGTYNGNLTVSDIEDSYLTLKEGSYGENVTKMKKRLQELGYFTQGAAFSDQYNSITTERVKLFQKVNGLSQTGVANDATLKLLYSNNAKANPNPM